MLHPEGGSIEEMVEVLEACTFKEVKQWKQQVLNQYEHRFVDLTCMGNIDSGEATEVRRSNERSEFSAAVCCDDSFRRARSYSTINSNKARFVRCSFARRSPLLPSQLFDRVGQILGTEPSSPNLLCMGKETRLLDEGEEYR